MLSLGGHGAVEPFNPIKFQFHGGNGMPLRIFNNLNSIVAQNRLSANNDNLGESIGKVASGDRLTGNNTSGADKAVSELLRSDARTLRQAARNLNDGISLINVAEGGLNEQSGILIRMREVLTAADGALGDTARSTLQLEINSLKNEFNRIANATEFNGQKLLDGSLSSSVAGSNHVSINIGLDSSDANRIDLNDAVNVGATDTVSIGIDNITVNTFEEALEGLPAIEKALATISQYRGNIGAAQNRLERALGTLNVSVENLNAASSVIKDADLAEELTELTRQQLLVQSSSAMVGQANLIPEGVLLLLQQ